jgi:hypothetical protein
VESTLGTTARVNYASLIEALAEDAKALRDAYGPVTTERLGLSEPATPLTEAMWSESPEHNAWQKRERERIRAAGASTTVDALKLLEAERFGR